ncbi:MAG: DUF5939 domain-containing protein, partial [Proteobacteria bacterium]|nr:DUF5939 domain-containing protein [Pseudomonadota bacterium]
WLWTIDVEVPPARMWPLLADVSQLNRAMNLPPMQFVERDGQRWGRARYTGVLHEWVEVPWNWVAGRWYELVRIYTSGAMRALYIVCKLEPLGAGTRVQIYHGLVPRSRLFDVGLRWSFGAMGRGYRSLLPKIAMEAMREPDLPTCLQAPPAPLRPEVSARLDQLEATLLATQLDPAPVRLLVDWVRTADDVSLERIRVLERARAWAIDERDLLRVCLHATRAGLLELTWDVVCPHCRGVRDQTTSLGALPTSGDCAACGISFGTDSLEAVEIAFHPHPSIRPVVQGVYCSAEPAHKPHIHCQRTLAPGATLDVPAPGVPGRYRVRVRGELRGAWLDVEADAPDEVVWPASALPLDGTKLTTTGHLRLVNDTTEPQIFVVETATWLELALRPGRLLSFQDFRDLFSDEYLGTDVRLAIGEQTILFTDLVGSTGMYARRGDASAFVDVKAHFETIFALVATHRGAVVKTIGDAVMAAFNDPRDAVQAAGAIQQAFPPAGALRLRISLNTGPCIAVHLNAAIDYFGHTVNIAAKLQALVEAGQVALAPATYAAPGVSAWLDAAQVVVEETPLEFKGMTSPMAAKRWTVA